VTNWENVSFDYVRLVGFTEPTRRWLCEVAEAMFGGDPERMLSLEQAAVLFFVLRREQEDSFPGGKWATIQHLESLIAAAADRAACLAPVQAGTEDPASPAIGEDA